MRGRFFLPPIERRDFLGDGVDYCAAFVSSAVGSTGDLTRPAKRVYSEASSLSMSRSSSATAFFFAFFFFFFFALTDGSVEFCAAASSDGVSNAA